MSQLPRLAFLPPEVFENTMLINEIDFGHKGQQPIAPFKGSKFIVYPSQTSPLDIHDVKECWFVASGTGIVTYNGQQTEEIKPGDVLYFESQQSHDVYNNGTENLMIFSVWWNK
jgi:methionyl-tRNA synthetase